MCRLEVKWTNPHCVSFDKRSFKLEQDIEVNGAVMFQNVIRMPQSPFSIRSVELGHILTQKLFPSVLKLNFGHFIGWFTYL